MSIPFMNPATGKQFGEVSVAGKNDVKQALTTLRHNAPLWHRTSVKERVRILRKWQKTIVDYADHISAVVSQDTGKSRQDALLEVFMALDKINTYLKKAPSWLARRHIPTRLYPFRKFYTEPKPFGVVAVIGPWNYPFDLGVSPIFSALLAGNVVIYKPSEVTAATGQLVEKLFASVPELSPYVQVVHGGPATGEALVNAKPDLVFLTGSTTTGRHIAQATAENMIPFICELGGKDPMIVLEDADIQAAARWGAWAGYFHAGQSCASIERIYVLDSVYEDFLGALLAETHKIKVGYTSDINNPFHFGPMTFERQATIVKEHLQDALDKGAQIIIGGRQDGMFIEPTILTNVNHDMRIMQEETFGPILPVMKVTSEEEAIALANDSEYGLSASVWSRNLKRAEQIAHQLQVGTVTVNDALSHYAVPELPFGGVKKSGNARTHGQQDVLQFTQLRSFAIGNPPRDADIGTYLRQPGRYHLAKGILQAVFGITPQQKLEVVTETVQLFEEQPLKQKMMIGMTIAGILTSLILMITLKRKA